MNLYSSGYGNRNSCIIHHISLFLMALVVNYIFKCYGLTENKRGDQDSKNEKREEGFGC